MKMLSETDMKIISVLRNNARKKITELSRDMDIPVTTLYDKVRAQHKKGILKKHVSMLDFSKIGYFSRAILAMSIRRDKRDKLQQYLEKHPNVNSMYRVDLGHDFVVEVVFENIAKLQEFIDRTDALFAPDQMRTFNILQEIKKEEFLANMPVDVHV